MLLFAPMVSCLSNNLQQQTQQAPPRPNLYLYSPSNNTLIPCEEIIIPNPVMSPEGPVYSGPTNIYLAYPVQVDICIMKIMVIVQLGIFPNEAGCTNMKSDVVITAGVEV